MNLLLTEKRITFGALAKREGMHVSTIWRWALKGCKGHKLECFAVGHRRFTTEQAFERWMAAINDSVPDLGETPRQREAAIRRAESRAEALGI